MVSFFPSPYPDELLYSILARYYIRSANVSPKAALDELFGSTTVVATFDLPSHLKSLVSNLPLLSAHTVESFIERHTLYPLYASFLPPERASLVAASMRKHFQGDIHTRTGIMASSMPIYSHFRFCPLCVSEEIEQYGEPYWHRLHQVAGVLVCPVHYVLLHSSTVKIKGDNRHEFYAADEENCLFKPISVKYSNETFNKLVLLAQDIDAILKQPVKFINSEWYRKQYQALLIDKGLASASGHVYQKKLVREFIWFYGSDFLEAVHSNIENNTDSNWLSDIVRKHRKSFHPIRHLLLIRFLGQNINSFFTEDYVSKPFGDGPWVCFNGASKHYLERKVKSVSISYSRDSKKLMGTFSCTCGFVYSTSDSTVPFSNKVRFVKIKSFGAIWEQKLRQLLVDRKNSFREIGRRLKVDTQTVINHAKRLLIVPSHNQIEEEAKYLKGSLDEKRETNRNTWLELQQLNPRLGKTELRRELPHIYIWLYRYDDEWLTSNSPEKKKPICVERRVDWSERDAQILKLAQIAVEEMLEKNPPIRLTVSAIGKAINFRALFEKHLAKLPRTASFLTAKTESVEVFQVRRINWAISILKTKDDLLKSWKVVRLAGLKKDAANRLNTYIEREIQNASLQNLRRRVK